MSITSFAFLCCYAVLLLLYYVVPKKMQWGLLLAASIGYFLTAGELWLIIYPIAAIIIVYCGALYIDRVKEQKKKKTALSLIVVFCLLELAVLKYCNFGIYTYNALAMRLSFLSTCSFAINFPVPLGISFYTLALLGYLFDVYYEIGKPQKNFFKFALFGMYFPVMLSGPILRYRDVEEQLYAPHKFDYVQVTYGFQRMLWGFFKKLVIAERMAVIVNTVYGNYTQYPGIYIFIATVCFAFQLYADFSGGMDIVIGLSQTFGLKIAENFRTPYFSKSIQEFWRRWHMSLGSFFRDYVYIPLGGNRKHQLLNIAIVWFLTGFWHGASWNFIFWGIYYGIWLIIEKKFIFKFIDRIPGFIRLIYSNVIVLGGWVLFYFTDLGRLKAFLIAALGRNVGASNLVANFQAISHIWIILIMIVSATPAVKILVKKIRDKYSRLYALLLPCAVIVVMTACFALLVKSSYNPFLYFRF